MIYLDNAATTGHKPAAVINAVDNALRNLCANPGRSGYKTSQKAAYMVFSAREKIADAFGAEGAEQVVFTGSCTQSINFVLKGVLKEGDHVIVSNIEHNAVMRPLVKMGISYDTAKVSLYDDDETVENFKRLINRKTKMIFTSAASNVLGRRVPIERLGKLCKTKGILLGVDAAQAAGIIPFDMQKDNIDFLCIAAHKGLYAPMGLGILLARQKIENTLIEGGTGTESINLQQPQTMPERMESGTINVPHIAGVSAGLGFVLKMGESRILRYETELINYAYKEFCKMPNLLLYTPRPKMEQYVPVLSFNVKGYTSDEVARILDEKGISVRAGLHCAPSAHKVIGTLQSGTVRIAPSVFNKPQEIETLLRVIKNIKKL